MRARFETCTFDSEARQLLRNGEPMALSPKAYQLLELLLGERPRALSKEEIQERLWPDTFVSEASLAGLVSDLRKAVGESGREAQIIRTVHAFGYAFAAEVECEAQVERKSRFRLVLDGRDLPLVEGENVLGRAPEVAVAVDSKSISRHHARIRIAGASASLEDLGSKNGTWLNGKPVSEPVPIANGDTIQIGKVFLTFREASAGGSTETMRH